VSAIKPPKSPTHRDATNSLRQAYRQAKLAEAALEKAEKHSAQRDLLAAFLMQAKAANQKAIEAMAKAGLLLRRLD
jgi:hypothetical protein